MAHLVDTSVWSLAFRRDTASAVPAVEALRVAIATGHTLLTTGVIVQEVIQGFVPLRVQAAIIDRMESLACLVPTWDDYLAAAELSNTCRRNGVQLETVDALIAQLCIAHDLYLLTTDNDFRHASDYIPLRLWSE